MTIPYDVSQMNMKKYKDNLFLVEEIKEDKLYWYSKSDKQLKPLINNKDIHLLVTSIQHIVTIDFEKTKKLMKYLKNIATVCTLLGLPIIWTLPHGLIVRQSYLETKSTSIRPFIFSKTKINLQVADKTKLDKAK